MTGYAARDGGGAGWRWSWEIRSVNGRGLDLRLRLPDAVDGIEAPLRKALGERVSRGNVTVSLRLARDAQAAAARLDPGALDAVIAHLGTVEERAAAAGLALAPSTAAEILGMRGILEAGEAGGEAAELRPLILGDIPALLDEFVATRETEGAALATFLTQQIDSVAAHVAAARALAGPRSAHLETAFREALARVTRNDKAVDAARVAQEIAVLAVKADVTEELDRLDTHIAAARALVAGEGARGRKLEFLIQEFNREANTLCSKSAYGALTGLGLELKHAIDQMREQTANVE